MKNLEQIRATNAMAYAHSGVNTRGAQGGEVVKKLPALIMSNGLLAAGAFAFAQKEDSGWRFCFDSLAAHLAHPDVAVVEPKANKLDALLTFLTQEADSHTLKRATEEALAWLAYAKRFVKKGADEEDDK